MSFVHRWRPRTSPWTLLLLHGTGGDERQLLGLAEALAPDWGCLSPLGKVREGTAARWFRLLADGVFDLDDLRARSLELVDWLEAARRDYGFDPGRLVAVGCSNGATAAGAAMLLRSGAWRGALLLRPSVPFTHESPVDLRHAATLLCGGRLDSVVAPEATDEMASVLRRCGADVSVAWHEGGNELRPADVAAGRAWLARLATGSPGRS